MNRPRVLRHPRPYRHQTMTAENTTRASGHECIDAIDELTAKTTAALAGRLESRDYDFSSIDEWDPLQPGTYPMGETDVDGIEGGMRTEGAQFHLEREHLPESRALVSYTESGVALEYMAKGDSHSFDALANFTPEQAREVAYALLIAAEEYERRPKRETVDGGAPEQ